MLDPILRRRYGIYAIVLAVVFAGISTAAGVGTAIRRDAVAEDLLASKQECVARLGLLGATASIDANGASLTANWNGVDQGIKTLSNASTGALACPGWVMTNFCMGEGCGASKASMTLRRVGA